MNVCKSFKFLDYYVLVVLLFIIQIYLFKIDILNFFTINYNTVFLSRFGAFLKSMFTNNKQHRTIDYLQKPYSKSFVHLSKVSIYINEHISAIRINSPYVIIKFN